VIRELAIDHDRLRWIVNIVLDLFELRNLGAFGDVERAVLKASPFGRSRLDAMTFASRLPPFSTMA